jgi:hypothetical protein
VTSLNVVEPKRYVEQDSFIHERNRYVPVTETEFKYFKMDLLCYILGSVSLVVSSPVLITRTAFKSSSCYVHGIFGARIRFVWGMRWHSWLRHCPTRRKVAGSIPDDVIGIFH